MTVEKQTRRIIEAFVAEFQETVTDETGVVDDDQLRHMAAWMVAKVRGDVEGGLDLLGLHHKRADTAPTLWPSQDMALLYGMTVESECKLCGKDHVQDQDWCKPAAHSNYRWRYVTKIAEQP
jgi:hypothetical protein